MTSFTVVCVSGIFLAAPAEIRSSQQIERTESKWVDILRNNCHITNLSAHCEKRPKRANLRRFRGLRRSTFVHLWRLYCIVVPYHSLLRWACRSYPGPDPTRHKATQRVMHFVHSYFTFSPQVYRVAHRNETNPCLGIRSCRGMEVLDYSTPVT
jgi:hypothetical protein